MTVGKFTEHLRQFQDLSLDEILRSLLRCLKTSGWAADK